MAKSSKESGLLPKSGGEVLDKAGVSDSGYLDKKGTSGGCIELPPGMKIEEQSCADIRALPLRMWKGGLSFPGDGW